MNSSVFWVITQRRLVSNRRFGNTYPVFKGQAVFLKMGQIGISEMAVLNKSTLRNIITQKTEEFSSTVVEAYDLALNSEVSGTCPVQLST